MAGLSDSIQFAGLRLAGDPDEAESAFRTDRHHCSGVDPISGRSEATLADGLCRK
jgi:hypothetical protein